MNATVAIFKALADETRLRIVALLLAEQELCVCDIIDSLKLPQSTVSRHLAYLRKSGLVKDRRCGNWMYYSIPRKGSEFHSELLELIRSHVAQSPATATDRACLQELAAQNRCT